MAKCYTQKARKEYFCGKCNKLIMHGDLYHKIEERFAKTRYRCVNCKPERSELTGSDYLSWLYNLQDHLTEMYDLDTEDSRDELVSELESKRDELQERRDNMAEQLQEVGSGEILGNRIQSLDDAIDSINSVDYPDQDDDEYKEQSDEPVCTDIYPLQFRSENKYLEGENKDSVDDSMAELGFTSEISTDEEDVPLVVTYTRKEDELVVRITFDYAEEFDEDSYDEALEAVKDEISETIGGIEE